MTEIAPGKPGRLDRARQAARRSRLRNISVASRLSLLVLVVTISSLVVTSVISLTYGERLALGLLENRQTALLALKSDRVERYFANLERSATALAISPVTGNALVRFDDAYKALEGGSSEANSELITFYREEFAPGAEAALGPGTSWSRLVPESAPAIYLQEEYVAGVPVDERALRDDAGDDSEWSEVHAALHPAFREIVDRLGLADLYLIDLRSGDVVYSTAKQPDFATNLETGPYSGSALAAVSRRVRSDPSEGIQIADMAPYLGEAGVPAAFMATPIESGGTLVGALVFELGSEALTDIMTAGGDWASLGLGETGETFLVGADGTLRSEPRLLIEDPATYFSLVGEAGTADSAALAAMRQTGTAVAFQKVVDPATIAELGSEPAITTSYLGREVYAAYRPLGVEALDWQVATEMERAEVEGPVVEFRGALLIAVALFVVGITFATVWWSRRVFEPVRAVSDRLRRARAGEDVVANGEFRGRAPTEFVGLARAIDGMLEASLTRHRQITAAAHQRLVTMRALLPSGIADRVQAGERSVIDDIPQATIVVVTFNGLGAMLAAEGTDSGRRRIGELVDRLDEVAAEHGLEPVKLIGDSYFAGCGLNRPFLDHVPRSVLFALEARAAMRGVDPDGNLALSIGIATGPVTVGLTGSSRLVYDLWGVTVNTASLLARMAAPDRILVTPEAGQVLPEGLEIRPYAEDTQGFDVSPLEVVGPSPVGVQEDG